MEIVDRDRQVLVNLATPDDINVLNSLEYEVTREQMGKGSIAMYKGETQLMYWILASNNLFIRTLLDDEIIMSEFENIYFDDLIICGTIQDDVLTVSKVKGSTLINIGGIDRYYSGSDGRIMRLPMTRLPILNELLTLKGEIRISGNAVIYYYYRFTDGSIEHFTLPTNPSLKNMIMPPPTHSGKAVEAIIIYMDETVHNAGNRFWINDLMILEGRQVDKHIQYFEGMKTSYEEQFDGSAYDIEITGSTRNKMTLDNIISMEVPDNSYTLVNKDGRETIYFNNITPFINGNINIELDPFKQYEFSYDFFYDSDTSFGLVMRVIYSDGTVTTPNNYQVYNEWATATLRTVPGKYVARITFSWSGQHINGTWFDINTLYCQEIGTNCDGSYYVENDSNGLFLSIPIPLSEGNEIDLVNSTITQNFKRVIMDGDETDIVMVGTYDDIIRFDFRNITDLKVNTSTSLKTDKFSKGIIGAIPYRECIAVHSSQQSIIIQILASRLNNPNLNGLREWLRENNLPLEYELTEPIIHSITSQINTIETYNEHTILSTNTVIKPSLDYSVRRVGVTYDV